MQVVQLLESRKNKLELIALPFPFPDNAVMNTTNPPTYLPTYVPTYLPTYLPTNIPTHLPTYRPTNLPTSFRETTWSYFQLATRTTQSFSAPLSATNKELETKKLTADRAVDGRGGIEEEGTVDRVIGGRGTELESTVWGRGWVNVDWRVEKVCCLKAQQKYCPS